MRVGYSAARTAEALDKKLHGEWLLFGEVTVFPVGPGVRCRLAVGGVPGRIRPNPTSTPLMLHNAWAQFCSEFTPAAAGGAASSPAAAFSSHSSAERGGGLSALLSPEFVELGLLRLEEDLRAQGHDGDDLGPLIRQHDARMAGLDDAFELRTKRRKKAHNGYRRLDPYWVFWGVR